MIGVMQSVAGVEIEVERTFRVVAQVIDGRGGPCADGYVSLTSSRWPRVGELNASTDSDGKAIIEGVPKGEYEAFASCKGSLRASEHSVVSVTRDIEDLVFRTQPGGRIEGRVVDALGAPAAGVRVLLAPTVKDHPSARKSRNAGCTKP